MAIDYSKWDKTYKVSEKDVKEMEQNNNEYGTVPYGNYEVKVTLLELTETKKTEEHPETRPMVSIRFKIVDGKHKGSIIFVNKLVTTTAQIHFTNELLRSLGADTEIKWNGNYRDYADMIQNVFDEIEDSLEYGIKYEDVKGYPNVRITDIWDVDND